MGLNFCLVHSEGEKSSLMNAVQLGMVFCKELGLLSTGGRMTLFAGITKVFKCYTYCIYLLGFANVLLKFSVTLI